MSLSSQQRREQIYGQILEYGHVTVKDVASKLDVSEATIRRDLRSLADLGQLELVYGGATLPRSTDFSYLAKAKKNVDAKRRIGRLAAQLVSDGETLMLDSGTTVSEMTAHLKGKRGLSIILNSTRLAMDLGGIPDANIIVLGGQYRPERMDTVGSLTTSLLEEFRGYRAFVGADGLSMDFGVTAADLESAHLYRLALRHAREGILLVDHSKFLTPSTFRICGLEDISRIVTDQRPPEEWIDYLNANGIELHYPQD